MSLVDKRVYTKNINGILLDKYIDYSYYSRGSFRFEKYIIKDDGDKIHHVKCSEIIKIDNWGIV